MRVPLFPGVPRPVILAHRGCSNVCPENTMVAFRMAEKKGIPGIELDVQLSSDSELMVFHDRDLSRICGINRRLAECSSNELSRMDAGSWKAREFSGSGIPLLKEVIRELGETILIDIEVKYYDPARQRETVKALNQIITPDRVNPERICFSSFDPRIVKALKKAMPRFATGLIYDRDSLPRYLPLKAVTGYCKPDFLKPRENLLKAGRKGVPRLCWTVDDPGTAENCIKQGADGIISNRPEELIQYPGL